jgi:hypothetical protein
MKNKKQLLLYLAFVSLFLGTIVCRIESTHLLIRTLKLILLGGSIVLITFFGVRYFTKKEREY